MSEEIKEFDGLDAFGRRVKFKYTDVPLRVDPLRWEHREKFPGTGIYVRAVVPPDVEGTEDKSWTAPQASGSDMTE
jgi:hypothetical protein